MLSASQLSIFVLVTCCISFTVSVTVRSSLVRSHDANLAKRDDCTTQTVVSGDSCGSLASRCGISANDFSLYNSDPDLCSTLAVGERVCCSTGTLPDIKPKPNSDGTCASYVVQSGDTCSAIAASSGLQVQDLATFNDKSTWGWAGCDKLGAQLKICVSPGNAPMPQPLDNAVCGPLKPNSSLPGEGQQLADLNPCPLNSCCTIWGQCGITPAFCTNETGSTGNPGTAPSGHDGCVSNCGTSIANNAAGPEVPVAIGYYESWNFDRLCLNMRADSINTTKYTHIHWAFASITSGFDVQMNDTYDQWGFFTNMTGVKRILSIGGWGFSTDPSTYDIFREAVSPNNAEAFANNVINFVNTNDLDGVDFDWEYPGAPDIPGIPSGSDSDGPDYLAFLKTIRSKLTNGKSVSIAAPASYWYLKQFPISEMAEVLDYIVYMTYDLHGQWDYGNKWSQDGCPSGSCLRSHVNLTETNYALAMITKAGVPANKIAIGISSYGRSFGMTDSSCTGPMCTFGGPNSTASPGNCTGTAGYISNAEIDLLMDPSSNNTWYDTDSNSNILTYGNDWVSFMDDDTRTSRTGYYQSLNFAGTVDWAIDLLDFTGDDGDQYGNDTDSWWPDAPPLPDCSDTYNTLDDLNNASNDIPDYCQALYSMQALNGSLAAAIQNYTDMMSHGYDAKFKTYAKAIVDHAGKSVEDFMNNNGSTYFSCVKDHPQAVRELITKSTNVPEPCPPDYSKRGFGPDNPYEQSVTWTLLDDKADQFYADLLTTTGIDKDKIHFGDYDRGNGCPPSTKKGNGDSCWGTGYDYNIPMPRGYSVGDVANPKDVVQKALANAGNIQEQVHYALIDLTYDAFCGDSLALVDASSVPVLMIMNAVESMQEVETVAHEIDEEKKKAMILAFIGALLFFLPIAGQVLGAVTEVANIASILAIVAVAGDVALGVYQVVSDPSNPLLGIMSIVLAPLALGDILKVTKAANIRRGMSDDDIAKLGGKIAQRMAAIKKVTGTCHKL